VPGFAQVVAAGPSVAAAYATVEADAAPVLAGSARQSKPLLLYPSPVTTADVVLATVPGRAGDRLRDVVPGAVRDLLADHGWRVVGGKPGTAPVQPPLPATSGMPDPGLLEALRQAWREAAR
jgi:hypothetical protein